MSLTHKNRLTWFFNRRSCSKTKRDNLVGPTVFFSKNFVSFSKFFKNTVGTMVTLFYTCPEKDRRLLKSYFRDSTFVFHTSQ